MEHDGYDESYDDDGFDAEDFEDVQDLDDDDDGDDLEDVARSACEDGYGAAQEHQQVDRELDALERKYPELRDEGVQEEIVREAVAVARRAGGLPESAMPAIIENIAQARGFAPRSGRASASDPGDSILNAAASGRFRLGA